MKMKNENTTYQNLEGKQRKGEVLMEMLTLKKRF